MLRREFREFGIGIGAVRNMVCRIIGSGPVKMVVMEFDSMYSLCSRNKRGAPEMELSLPICYRSGST